MPELSRDDETDIAEQAERAAQFYIGLVREGVPQKQAADITCAWVLGQLRKDEPEPR